MSGLDQVSVEIGRLTAIVKQLQSEVAGLRADVRTLMDKDQRQGGMFDVAKAIYGFFAGICGALTALLAGYFTGRAPGH